MGEVYKLQLRTVIFLGHHFSGISMFTVRVGMTILSTEITAQYGKFIQRMSKRTYKVFVHLMGEKSASR